MSKIFFLEDSVKGTSRSLARRRELQLASHKLQQTLIAEGYDVERFLSAGELCQSVKKGKPQLVMLHEYAGSLASRLTLNYPFLPVIIYGELARERKAGRFIKRGAARCIKAPYEKELVIPAVKDTLWFGLAKENLWDKQLVIASGENRKRVAGNLMTLACSVLVVVSLVLVLKDRLLTANMTLYSKTYDSPYSSPTGISLYDSYLWITDWKAQNIYKHLPEDGLPIKAVFSFPEKRISAVTFGAGCMWSCDPWSRKIYKHKLDGNMDIIGSFAAPGPNPVAIGSGDRCLWTCDNAENRIYKLDILNNLAVLRSYPSPGPNPMGVFSDGINLWTADGTTNKIYRHKLDDSITVDAEFILPESMKLSSMDGDGENIWICSEKEAKIFRYPKKLLLEPGEPAVMR